MSGPKPTIRIAVSSKTMREASSRLPTNPDLTPRYTRAGSSNSSTGTPSSWKSACLAAASPLCDRLPEWSAGHDPDADRQGSSPASVGRDQTVERHPPDADLYQRG